MAIEKNNGQLDSFETGGGIILAFFCVYVVIAAFVWYKGSSQRDRLKKEAVERELELEREAMEGAFWVIIYGHLFSFINQFNQPISSFVLY